MLRLSWRVTWNYAYSSFKRDFIDKFVQFDFMTIGNVAVIVNEIRLIDFPLILNIFKCCSEQLVWFGGIRSNSLARLFIFWEPVYSLPAFSLFHLGGFTGPYSVTKRIPYCLNNHFFLFFFISRKYGNQGYIFSW